MNLNDWWNETDRGKLKYSEGICKGATSPLINLTWTGLESSLGLHGEKPTKKLLTAKEESFFSGCKRLYRIMF